MRTCLRAAIGALAISMMCLIGNAGVALAEQTITSAGPLTSIYLGENLDCQADHVGDLAHEFFGEVPGACATFIAPAGTESTTDVYGADVPAGLERTPYTPVSQSGVTGAGTSANPFQVVTVVDAGETGLRIQQADSYVIGDEFYRTDIQVLNTTGAPIAAVLYHAADCFLQDSDDGYGFLDPVGGGIYCSSNANNTPADRIEGFVPLSAGSQYVESEYEAVWTLLDGSPLPNTCDCDVLQDNGAGLSWQITVPAGGSVVRSLLTAFSPSGEPPPPPNALTLLPASGENPVGTSHTVTATLTQGGNPVSGAKILFTVTGANTGSGTGTTGSDGKASFTYSGSAAGDDSIRACHDPNGNSECETGEQTATATKRWVGAGPPTQLGLSPATATNAVGTSHCVSAHVEDGFGNQNGGVTVRFRTSGATSASGAVTTNTGGNAQFCYSGPAVPGTDSIAAFADTDSSGAQDGAEPGGTAAKTWTAPESDCGVKITGGGWISTNDGWAHFNTNVKTKKKSGLEGKVRFNGPGISVNSLDILVMTCADRSRATVFGIASVNGSGPRQFRIDVADLGEPGRNDTYRMRTDTGYDSGEQRVARGNIQVHKK